MMQVVEVIDYTAFIFSSWFGRYDSYKMIIMLHSCSLQFHGNLMFNKNRQGGDRWDFVIKDGPIFWKGGFHKVCFF